ncbi:hypothetical protein B484DRAFT_431799, partial [Ochromonadaceae sp. CCMP2298]
VRLYSALVIQRNYFIYKGAFHTFFLTCALRCREEEDLAVVRKESLFGRHVTSARIQQFYQRRYFKRYVSAVVKVQCWYRGRQGYDIVDILRRERWAGRKIRSWVRVRVGRRSTRARRIQHWWWGNKRHWRARGSMQTALETVRALRRERSNPFQNCRTPHDTLLLARRSSARYYSSQDPRVGLRVSSLLFRMGCLELLDMFPRKSTWQDRVERAQQGKNKSQKGKRRNFPHALFEALVEVVAPPPMPRDPRIERALARCEDSNTVNEALGELLGRGGGGDGGGGAGAGGGGRDKSASAEERRWDSERMSSCASTMQLTVDRLLVLLPPGRLRTMLERANNRVTGYLRRVQFTRRLLTEQRKTGKSVDYTDEYADPSDTHKEAHSTGAGGQGHGLAEVVQGVGAAGVAGEGHGRGPLDITDPTVLSTVLPIQRSLDIPYLADLEALELEESVSVCRLYCQVVEQIADLSLAVQSIKNAWANKSMRRAMVQEKLRMFKDEQRAQYTSERQTDK